MVDIWEELNQLWREYFALTVFKNEHLIKPLFHCWVGVHLTHHYKITFCGQGKTFRVHPFILQESGTGKSVAMKTTHFLLEALGYRSVYTMSMNEPSLQGSILILKNGETKRMPGALEDRDMIFWDEGSVLFRLAEHSKNITEILQMTTDDPGYVSRRMLGGEVKFPTPTTICAGSYMEENIEKTILRKGLFQRMWTVFHTTTTKEKLDYFKNKHNMIAVHDHERKLLIEKIKNTLSKLAYSSQWVVINKDDYATVIEQALPYFEENMLERSFKDKKENILSSFISRNDLILNLAGQRAVLSGRFVVNKEDLEYGLEHYKQHIRSAVELLQGGQKIEDDRGDERIKIIVGLIRKRPLFYNITKLRDELVQREDWDIGKNVTGKFLNKLLLDKVIFSKDGEKNTILLFV